MAENRVLASFPRFHTADRKLNVHFFSDFQNWFNDNLGFRDQLVQANSVIQYDLFRNLTKSDTLLGKDNWLYYFTPEILADYQNDNLPTQSQLKTWGNAVQKVDSYLKSRNIPFIYTLDMDKKTIYPENYPSSILKVHSVSRSDMFTDYMTKDTNVDFFTPKNELLAAKSGMQVYYQNVDNAHWNSNGAYIGYQLLMQHIQKYLPSIRIIPKSDFTIVNRRVETKVYNAVSFFETEPDYNLKVKPTASETQHQLDPLNLIYSNLNYTYENQDKSLPKILIFGDSYFYTFQLPVIAESFSQVVFIHTENIGNYQNYIQLFHPDVVVYENVERMFGHDIGLMADAPAGAPDYHTLQNLPTQSQPLMYVDNCNGAQLASQSSLSIGSSDSIAHIVGWAVDPHAGTTAGNVYLKVGDHVYAATYGTERTSVSDYYKNEQYRNSGFVFDVDAQELKKAGKCSFIVISNDQTRQYAPVDMTVTVH